MLLKTLFNLRKIWSFVFLQNIKQNALGEWDSTHE